MHCGWKFNSELNQNSKPWKNCWIKYESLVSFQDEKYSIILNRLNYEKFQENR